MTPRPDAHYALRAVGARSPEALYTDLGYADVLYDRLRRQIRSFEEGLGEDEELGCLLASFGREMVVRIREVGYHNPYFIVFYGEDAETGERVQLVQHVIQVSVLLKAIPKTAAAPRARRIGFWGDREEPAGAEAAGKEA